MRYAQIVLFTAALAFATPSVGLGFSEFQREFRKMYTRGSGVDKDFRKLVMKAKCYVCHAGSEDEEDDDHKPNNRYGDAMARHAGEGDKKDKKKIIAALEAIADESSDPNDPDAPTFGELIAAGELPGGALEEVKKPLPKSEPAASP